MKGSGEASTIITDEIRGWIGRTEGPFPLPEPITSSDVRRYIEATGDDNPLWTDDEVARAAGYRGPVVPLMMVLELYRRTTGTGEGDAGLWAGLPLPENYTDARNAGSEIEWLAPVYLGDRLVIEHRLVDIVARQGRVGLGIYLTRLSEFRKETGEVVVRMRQTAVRLPQQSAISDQLSAGPKAEN